MRVIIDTSTFIRATIEENRTAWRCIRNLMRSSKILLSDEMAKELLVAIYQSSGRKGRNPLPAFRIASTFLLYAEPIEKQTNFPWCSDPEDAMFIECAIDGKADVVISNDHSLTTLKSYLSDEQAIEMVRDIEFLTPEQFLEKNKI